MEGEDEPPGPPPPPAHVKYNPEYDKEAEIPTNRPKYRRGRKDTAVKVYTIALESKYLIVRDVPAYGVIEDLIKMFAVFGPIEEYRLLDDVECEQFTDVYWIKFANVDAARAAKRKLDNYSFFGKQIKVRYGPEYETLKETEEKLLQRQHYVRSVLEAEDRREQEAARRGRGGHAAGGRGGSSSSSSSGRPHARPGAGPPSWRQQLPDRSDPRNPRPAAAPVPPAPPAPPDVPRASGSALDLVPRTTERAGRDPAAGARGGRAKGGFFGRLPEAPGVPPTQQGSSAPESVDYFPSDDLNQTVLSIRQKLRRVEKAPRPDVGAGRPPASSSPSSYPPASSPASSPPEDPAFPSSDPWPPAYPPAAPLYPSASPDYFGAPIPPNAAFRARRFEAEEGGYEDDPPPSPPAAAPFPPSAQAPTLRPLQAVGAVPAKRPAPDDRGRS